MKKLNLLKNATKKVIFGKEGGESLWDKMTKKPKERIDKNFPLGIRLNGKVEIKGLNSKFILAKDKFEISKPKSSNARVVALGEIDLGDGLKVYRAYLVPNGGDERDIFFIDMEMFKNQVDNIKMFVKLDEIYPDSMEEWQSWLDGSDEDYANIGGPDFITPSEKVYKRVWDSESESEVQVEFIEKLYDEPYDENIEIFNNRACLYGRNIDEDDANSQIEYLFVSAVEDEKEEAFIEIHLGIDLTQADLNII